MPRLWLNFELWLHPRTIGDLQSAKVSPRKLRKLKIPAIRYERADNFMFLGTWPIVATLAPKQLERKGHERYQTRVHRLYKLSPRVGVPGTCVLVGIVTTNTITYSSSNRRQACTRARKNTENVSGLPFAIRKLPAV